MSREGSHDNYYGDDNYRAPTMGELNAPDLQRSRGAFARALNQKTLSSTCPWSIICRNSQELMENLRNLISNAYMAFAKF
ncbi:unnamed protein product [Rhodiola kirilowii]